MHFLFVKTKKKKPFFLLTNVLSIFFILMNIKLFVLDENLNLLSNLVIIFN